jgi:hypothetical protein
MDPSMVCSTLPLLVLLPLSLLALPLALPAALVGGYVGLGTVIYSTLLGGIFAPLLVPLALLTPLVGCPSCQIPSFQMRY